MWGHPLSEIKKEREEAILAAAVRVFQRRGFHEARMAEIAQEAGISYGLVYHYYRGKAELFDAILSQFWTGLYAMLDKASAGDAPIAARLGIITEFFLDQYDRRPDLVNIFITEVSRSTTNLTEARLDTFKMLFTRTERMISRAQQDGELRADISARYLATVFLGAVETFVSTMVLNRQPIKNEAQKKRIAAGIIEVFFNGAAAGGERRPSPR